MFLFDHTAIWLGHLLFFILIYIPVAFDIPKIGMMLLLCTIILIQALLQRGQVALHPIVFYWSIFYVLLGLFFDLRGFMYGTPGAAFYLIIYIIFPLIYISLVAGIRNEVMLINLLRTLVFAAIALSLTVIGFVLDKVFGILPGPLAQLVQILEKSFGLLVNTGSGAPEMDYYGLSSLIFTVPYLLAAIFTYTKSQANFMQRRWLWAALILSVVPVLTSGRRALWLVIGVSPIIFMLLNLFRPGHNLRLSHLFRSIVCVALFILVITMILSNAMHLDWNRMVTSFFSGFDFQYDDDALARREQFYGLLNGWLSHPLLGNGLGAFTYQSLRSERAWQYELQYMLLLFNTGLIGTLLYSTGVIWIYWMAIRIIRSGSQLGVHLIPVMTGTSAYLIANATNPYLQAYGRLWSIFLPLAFINCWLLLKPCNSSHVMG